MTFPAAGAQHGASVPTVFLIVTLKADIGDLAFKEVRQGARMGLVTTGAVIFSRFVPVLALVQRFVAVKAAKRWFRGSGMRIVAIAALRFQYRGMNNFTGCLGLVARFACSPFHGDLQ